MHPYESLYQQLAICLQCCHSLLLLGLFGILCFPLQAQQTDYFDGPYIFQQTDSLQLKWIERGVPHDTTIASADAFSPKNKPTNRPRVKPMRIWVDREMRFLLFA